MEAGAVVLADPLSGARQAGTIAHYDAVLRQPAVADLTPDAVYRIGELPTSKPLREWLAALDVRQVLEAPPQTWPDPDSVASVRGAGPVEAILDVDQEWTEAWRHADAAAARALAGTLGDRLSEPLVAADLGARLPPDAILVAASSMPIRDVETFFPTREDPPRVVSNRGANGIDGTISTLFGVAAAGDGPAVALIGDVAFLHDAGGLLAATRLGLKATIVLLNNDGGGIFHFLPVAGSAQADVFEQQIATAHDMDFSRLAAAYGCEHRLPSTRTDFHAALDEALASDTTTVIEIRTDREQNVALHRRCWDAVARALTC